MLISRKRYKIEIWLWWKINRKSYMAYQMTLMAVTPVAWLFKCNSSAIYAAFYDFNWQLTALAEILVVFACHMLECLIIVMLNVAAILLFLWTNGSATGSTHLYISHFMLSSFVRSAAATAHSLYLGMQCTTQCCCIACSPTSTHCVPAQWHYTAYLPGQSGAKTVPHPLCSTLMLWLLWLVSLYMEHACFHRCR